MQKNVKLRNIVQFYSFTCITVPPNLVVSEKYRPIIIPIHAFSVEFYKPGYLKLVK